MPEQIACITLEINMIVRDLLVAGSHKHSNQRESYFMKPIECFTLRNLSNVLVEPVQLTENLILIGDFNLTFDHGTIIRPIIHSYYSSMLQQVYKIVNLC